MIYIVSNLTAKLYNESLVEIIKDDNLYEFQKYLTDVANGVELQYVDSLPFEIEELNKMKVPETISAMDLKLQLFDLGITDQDIFEDIDSIPNSMFPASEKQKAKIKYQSAAKFERYNADLNLVATMEGISQEQLDQIFINGNIR